MFRFQRLSKKFKETAVLIPTNVKENRQYDAYLEFIAHGENGLALESLLEMVDETGFIAPQKFWDNVRELAELMKMPKMLPVIEIIKARNS